MKESQTPAIRRDSQWVQREYGVDKWPRFLAEVEAFIAAGDRSLRRVYNNCVRTHVNRSAAAYNVETVNADVVFEGRIVSIPFRAGYLAYRGLVTEALIEACEGKVDVVVELGSGWARQTFDLWLAGGPTDAHYFGLELIEAGRKCSEMLASLEPDFKFRSAPFDYHAPDYEMLPSEISRMVVFSCHSIEQIPEVKPDVFLKLFSRAKEVDVLLFEPVGWQFSEHGAASEVDIIARSHAVANDYNRNLLKVIRHLEEIRALEIVETKKDFIGMTLENPTTFIKVRKI